MKPEIQAKLLLTNGTVFSGSSLGAKGEVTGEVCFNTGMTGYQEILTDPSYYGQLVTLTYPHIGNYGINEEDVESSQIQAAGLIIREETIKPSNFRAIQSLGDHLRDHDMVGIQNIDTRMLTRILRTKGAMNGIISTVDLDENSLLEKLRSVPSMNGMDLVKEVSCKKAFEWSSDSHAEDKPTRFKIAAIDYGIKHNILRLLRSHGCKTTIFPATISAEEILAFDPDGIFLSNGPGDPAAVTYGIQTVKDLLGKKPIFGICLGHQILALALGGSTFKLKFGHRGCNHPVKNIKTKKIEITSQNHGFSVDAETLPEYVEITHTSLNDETVEGIQCTQIPAFSIQYHPESSPGPHDSRYLFENFIRSMKN